MIYQRLARVDRILGTACENDGQEVVTLKRSVLVASTVAVLALLVSAPASAANSTVSLAGCIFAGGGNATVPAGNNVSVRFTWLTDDEKFTEKFLKAVTVTAAVDGTPVADTSSYWSGPTPVGDFSAATWLYDLGVTLGAGDSVVVAFQATLEHKVTSGIDPDTGKKFKDPAGDIFPPGSTCTITGA